jgi:Flp pilus assembly protein, pilin Flp
MAVTGATIRKIKSGALGRYRAARGGVWLRSGDNVGLVMAGIRITCLSKSLRNQKSKPTVGHDLEHSPPTIFVYMNRLRDASVSFLRGEEAAALAEYGILIAFIAIVAIAAVTFFGRQISDRFNDYSNAMS